MPLRLAAALALFAVGCHSRPRTPEDAYARVERAIAAADCAGVFPLVDGKTRAAIESVHHDERLQRTIISAKYPEAEAQAALAKLAAADESDVERYFVRRCAADKTLEGYRKRLGSVSGPIVTKPDASGTWVARKDGMPLHFANSDGRGWAWTELGTEWSLEKDRASHALQTVRDNAKLYGAPER